MYREWNVTVWMQINTNTYINALEGTCVLLGQYGPIIYGVLDNHRTAVLSEDWWWGPSNINPLMPNDI
jgi:hypothetical protein